MKNLNALFILLFTLMVSLSSCEVVGGIFKAGMWTAVIIIVLIVAIVLWLVSRMRGKR